MSFLPGAAGAVGGCWAITDMKTAQRILWKALGPLPELYLFDLFNGVMDDNQDQQFPTTL
jgi:hypothetical protein